MFPANFVRQFSFRVRPVFLMFVPLILASFHQSAEAGVRGKFFKGNFANNQNETAVSTILFGQNGEITFTQDFGQGVEPFYGTFDEIDLFLISFWNAELSDPTPDGVFQMRGIGIFGIFTTMDLTNLDVNLTAEGFYTIGSPIGASVPESGGGGVGGASSGSD